LHTRPHFTERGGLFGHGHRPALPCTGQGRSQAANASASNQHLRALGVCHEAIVHVNTRQAQKILPFCNIYLLQKADQLLSCVYYKYSNNIQIFVQCKNDLNRMQSRTSCLQIHQRILM
jgi:hypothetical protein